MRIGLFADVHGNLPAFAAVWAALQREACDRHVFLGDVCGYYFHGDEAIAMLRTIPRLHAVRGNHDALFLSMLDSGDCGDTRSAAFGLAHRLLRAAIQPANLDFLRRLPLQTEIAEIGLAGFHGSPWRPLDEYVHADSAADRFGSLPWRFVCLGHTHRPMDLEMPGVRVVNPGSVGQPRDGGWPSYAVLDSENGELAVRRVPFDVQALLADLAAYPDAHPYLADMWRDGERRVAASGGGGVKT